MPRHWSSLFGFSHPTIGVQTKINLKPQKRVGDFEEYIPQDHKLFKELVSLKSGCHYV